MKTIHGVLILLLLGRGSGASGASHGGDALEGEITLETVVTAALRENQGLKADSADIPLGQARLLQSRLPGNPELTVESENMSFSPAIEGEESDLSISLTQTFDIAAKRGVVSLAKRDVEAAQARYSKRRHDMIAEVKSAFFEVLLFQQELELNDSMRALAGRNHDAAVRRAIAGKVPFADTLRTSSEYVLSEIEHRKKDDQLQNARLYLAALCGSDAANFIAVAAGSDSLPPLPGEDTYLRALATAPAVRVWDSELKSSHAELGYEKARRIPPLAVGAGVETSPLSDIYRARGEVSISIPILDLNQGGVKAAKQAVAKVEYARKGAMIELVAQVKTAYRDAVSARRECELLSEQVVPQIKAAFEASYLAYTTGKLDLPGLLDAQRKLLEGSQAKLESVTRYRRGLIELERTTGVAALEH